MESGVKKRRRKDKLVPREVGEQQYETFQTISLLEVEEEAPVDPINETTKPDAVNSHLEFAVKVEVESCNEDFSIRASGSQSTTSSDNESDSELAFNINALDSPPYYITEKMIRQEINRISKRTKNHADVMLEIELENFLGLNVAMVKPSKHEALIQNCLRDWKEWAKKSKYRYYVFCYKCYICELSWWYLTPFRDHIKMHESLKLKIEPSSRDCNIIAYKNNNMKSTNLIPLEPCPYCLKQHSKNTKYTCEGCKAQFSVCSLLLAHEGSCVRYNKLRYQNAVRAENDYFCKLCGVFYIVKERYNEHMIIKHSVRNDEVIFWPQEKTCPSCSMQYFIYKYHQCQNRYKKYHCKNCYKKFATLPLLKMHKKQQKATTCTICDEGIEFSCMETMHVAAHSKFYTKCFVSDFFDGNALVYPNKASFFTRKSKETSEGSKYFSYVPIPKRCLLKSAVNRDKLGKVGLENVSQEIDSDLEVIEQDKVTYDVKNAIGDGNASAGKTERALSTDSSGETVDSYDEDSVNDMVISTEEKATDIQIKNTELEIDDYISEIAKRMGEKRKLREAELSKGPIVDRVEIKKEIVDDDEEFAAELNDINMEVLSVKQELGLISGVSIKEEIIDDDVEVVDQDVNVREATNLNEEVDIEAVKEEASMEVDKEAVLNEEVMIKDEIEYENEHDYSADFDSEFIKVFNGTSSLDYEMTEVKQEENSDDELYDDIITFNTDNILTKLEPEVEIHNQTRIYPLPKILKYIAEDLGKYKCSMCKKRHRSLKSYLKHLHKKHGLNESECPVCSKVVASHLSHFIGHVATHIKALYVRLQILQNNEGDVLTTKKNGIYQCKMCNEAVFYKDFFIHWEKHLKLQENNLSKHDKDSARNIEESPQAIQNILGVLLDPVRTNRQKTVVKSCEICMKKFDRWNDYKRHLIEHLLDDAYKKRDVNDGLQCLVCQKIIETPGEFRLHMRVHGGLPLYRCDLCAKTFSDSSNFVKHKKVHNTGQSCVICKRKFIAQRAFEEHMQYHTSTKKPKCTRCDQIFECPGAKAYHYKRCHKVDNKFKYHCRCCRSSFTCLKDKWDHMWLVHRERRVKADCPYCDMKFRKFISLKQHINKSHISEYIKRKPIISDVTVLTKHSDGTTAAI